MNELNYIPVGDYYIPDLKFPEELRLVINAGHPLVKTLVHMEEEGRHDDASLLAAQVYDLARLAQKPLPAEDLTAFMERSMKIMELVAEK